MLSSSRHALVLLVAGVMLVLSAGSGATAALLVTGKQIKNGTVTSKDIKNRSLHAKDLSRTAKLKLRGRTGATGATGATGPAGAAGLPGLPGLSKFEVVTTSVAVPAVMGAEVVRATCPAGKKALAATPSFDSLGANMVSQAVRVGPSAFEATGLNMSASPRTLTLDVVCAAVAD